MKIQHIRTGVTVNQIMEVDDQSKTMHGYGRMASGMTINQTEIGLVKHQ